MMDLFDFMPNSLILSLLSFLCYLRSYYGGFEIYDQTNGPYYRDVSGGRVFVFCMLIGKGTQNR